MVEQPEIQQFLNLIPNEMHQLLASSGKQLIAQIGMDAIRDVLYNIFAGKNIRNATEMLTRNRIISLNLATFEFFSQGLESVAGFVEGLPQFAVNALSQRGQKAEKGLAQWILGLTQKGIQNILRDDLTLLKEYVESYIETCKRAAEEQSKLKGSLKKITVGHIAKQDSMGWLWLVYLLNAIGAQTLSVRGSEKSTYGKLFEKLVLGTLLYILGFVYQPLPGFSHLEGVFWLSSTDEKRESDATLLYKMGKGVRFDIGFIGRGNSEISLDKVSRYQREIDMGRRSWHMATMIIVDRIGANSKIESIAAQIDGTIVQMSASFWIQKVARKLQEWFGFDHPLITMKHTDIPEYLHDHLQNIPIQDFIQAQVSQKRSPNQNREP